MTLLANLIRFDPVALVGAVAVGWGAARLVYTVLAYRQDMATEGRFSRPQALSDWRDRP